MTAQDRIVALARKLHPDGEIHIKETWVGLDVVHFVRVKGTEGTTARYLVHVADDDTPNRLVSITTGQRRLYGSILHAFQRQHQRRAGAA